MRIVSFRGAAPMVAVRAVAAVAVGSDQRTISGKFAKLKEQGKNHRRGAPFVLHYLNKDIYSFSIWYCCDDCGMHDRRHFKQSYVSYLHEPGVLQNLKSRYDMNEIYLLIREWPNVLSLLGGLIELNKLLIIVVVLSMALTPLRNEIGRRAAGIVDEKSETKEICHCFHNCQQRFKVSQFAPVLLYC